MSASTRLTPDIEEQPLLGRDGRLFGILTRPADGAAPGRPAIILASAGAVHRIGANRLYVTMARAWAERGFPVLRLDIGGIGDSLPFPGMTGERHLLGASRLRHRLMRRRRCRKNARPPGSWSPVSVPGRTLPFTPRSTLDGIVGIIMMNPIVFYWKPSDALEVSAWMTHKEVQRYQQTRHQPRLLAEGAAGEGRPPACRTDGGELDPQPHAGAWANAVARCRPVDRRKVPG